MGGKGAEEDRNWSDTFKPNLSKYHWKSDKPRTSRRKSEHEPSPRNNAPKT
eukprot:NODE_13712_length_252_cov_20.891626_g12799_i0.p4 GENE.NODE_13712_length_252_cov_20.891626_g12799_i0~~NODE_13712_length_252_cov_20.891626_g12799_i0.p4  ORF type:complete len:51 (-),score=15.84 NODE_13712_length_252_cov_20.891626_g12799_i0:71-223(-)